MTGREIGLLRLAAQRIAGSVLGTPAEAVRWLTAVQAQDFRGALTSVALRTTAGGRKEVEVALDAGEIVRSWPMRGTLHLTAAEDLVWLRELLAPRPLAGFARRRAQLGLDEDTAVRAGELAAGALAGGGRMSRGELLDVWQRAGVETTGQRGYHLLSYLGHTGALCLGPLRGGDQLFVLTEEWIRQPRRLDREQALGELALRYFRSHGPATVKDLTRWANLTAADARAGIALARPELTTLEFNGIEHLLDPQTPDRLQACRRAAAGVFLLPGFDEIVLGYGDRSAMLPPAYADRIVPGGNGVFQPTVVSDGRIVGTWRYTGRGPHRTVDVAPFEPLPDRVAAKVTRVAAALPG